MVYVLIGSFLNEFGKTRFEFEDNPIIVLFWPFFITACIFFMICIAIYEFVILKIVKYTMKKFEKKEEIDESD